MYRNANCSATKTVMEVEEENLRYFMYLQLGKIIVICI